MGTNNSAPRPPLYLEKPLQTLYLPTLYGLVNNQDNYSCPTNVQHLKYPKNDLKSKYLYKRGKIYYLSIRIGKTPYKFSLRSDNIEYCRIL